MAGMKDIEQIQRAHDILAGVLMGEVKIPLDAQTLDRFNVAATTLCWVLEHAHNKAFGVAIAKLEADLKALGYELNPGPPPPNRAFSAFSA
jgi:hypothetical protein